MLRDNPATVAGIVMLLCVAVLTTACRAAPGVSERTELTTEIEAPELDSNGVTGESSETIPSTPGELLPAPAVLPAAFSRVHTIGDVAAYYAIVDDEMRLIVFDRESRDGLFQIPAHPLGRIRGVGQGLVVDDELGLVFVTGTTDEQSEVAAYVAAHQAETGEEVWRQPIDFNSSQPVDCGTSICLRSFIAQVAFDKATGKSVESFPVNDRRILLNEERLWITTRISPVGRFLGLTGSRPGSRDELWLLDVDLIETATDVSVDPNLGWGADYDEANNAAVVYIAQSDGSAWATIGFDARNGRLKWGRTDLDPCTDTPFVDRPPIACDVDRRTGLFTEVAVLNAATGADVWSVPLDGENTSLAFDGADLVIWNFAAEITYQRVDTETGEATLGTTPVPCSALNPWHQFAYPTGDTADFAGSASYTLCSPDGLFMSPADIIAAAPTLDLGGHKLWLVDADGRPLAEAG